jgi:iron complex outermembrane receptor protein
MRIRDEKIGEFRILLNYIDLEAQIPSSLNLDMFQNEPTRAAPNWAAAEGYESYQKGLAGISYRKNISRSITINSTLFGQVFDNYEPRPFNILQEQASQYGGRTVVDWIPQAFSNLKVQSGGELFFENYQSNLFEIIEKQQGDSIAEYVEQRNYLNVFQNYLIEVTSTQEVQFGYNINHTWYTSSQQVPELEESKYDFGWVISPRIAYLNKFHPRNSLYLAASHGFAPPTVQETLYPDGTLNPSIKPEQGWSIESGIKGSTNTGKLIYDITAYWMFVNDLLVARRTAEDQFIGINAGSTWHQGVETQLNYHWLENEQVEINQWLSTALQFFTFREFLDGDDDYSGNDLTGVPTTQFSTGLDLNTILGFYGNLVFNRVGSLPITDDNSLYTDPYSLLNGKVGYRQSFFDKLIEAGVGLGVNNLMNQKYASQVLINASSFVGNAPRYYYPGLPRNFYIQFHASIQID